MCIRDSVNRLPEFRWMTALRFHLVDPEGRALLLMQMSVSTSLLIPSWFGRCDFGGGSVGGHRRLRRRRGRAIEAPVGGSISTLESPGLTLCCTTFSVKPWVRWSRPAGDQPQWNQLIEQRAKFTVVQCSHIHELIQLGELPYGMISYTDGWQEDTTVCCCVCSGEDKKLKITVIFSKYLINAIFDIVPNYILKTSFETRILRCIVQTVILLTFFHTNRICFSTQNQLGNSIVTNRHQNCQTAAFLLGTWTAPRSLGRPHS